MWSELLIGDHISTDVLVLNGSVIWHSHTRGHPLDGGTFDRWDVNIQYNDDLVLYLEEFIRQNLCGFSGPMNLETIGGKIIELHLRFADQWPDLYPPDFMEAVVMLSSGAFPMDGVLALKIQATGYSVILFGRRGRSHWIKPAEYEIQLLLRRYNISSIQLPFQEGQPAEQHSMPPGGFRLAVIDGFNLEECLDVRENLTELSNKANAFSGVSNIVGKRASVCKGNCRCQGHPTVAVECFLRGRNVGISQLLCAESTLCFSTTLQSCLKRIKALRKILSCNPNFGGLNVTSQSC